MKARCETPASAQLNTDAALPYLSVSTSPFRIRSLGQAAPATARDVRGRECRIQFLTPPVAFAVNAIDLTTLVTACALTIDPQVIHALIWHQSGGEPWAFSVSGRRERQVLRSVSDAFEAARATRPDDVSIRVGLAGLPATPRSITAAMFAPCSNIASVARQIAQLAELCRTSSRSKSDPIHCAVAAWHGSWERPDTSFADSVRSSVAKNDAPDFEMPSGAGIETADSGSSRRPARDAATASSAAPDDRERALQSGLFPITSLTAGHSANDSPAINRSVAGEQKAVDLTVHLTATQLRADGLFEPRSAPRSRPDRSDGISHGIASLRTFGGGTWQRRISDSTTAR